MRFLLGDFERVLLGVFVLVRVAERVRVLERLLDGDWTGTRDLVPAPVPVPVGATERDPVAAGLRLRVPVADDDGVPVWLSVADNDGVPVWLSDADDDGVPVWLSVADDESVPVWLLVPVNEAVPVRLLVPVSLDEAVPVPVSVALAVTLGVVLLVCVPVGVCVKDAVRDGVDVRNGVRVAVADHEKVGPPVTSSRMRMLIKSAMTTRPHADDAATPEGRFSVALVAKPQSPLKPPFPIPIAPLPAIVLMTPEPADTTRMRLFPKSAMSTLPAPSMSRPRGTRLALVAGPPSPLKPSIPLPANVVMMPVAAATRRMRLLPSPMSTFPLPSNTTPPHGDTLALVAGPPSPLYPYPPLPASVVMMPVPAATRRTRRPIESAMITFPLGSTASATGYCRLALVAAPPSPLDADTPLPANVVMTPVTPSTLRTRLLSLSAISTRPPSPTATPEGKRRRALVAAPPSPLNPNDPLPASVVTIPVAASILRMRWLCISATSRLQPPSKPSPNGCITASAATPPSPPYPAVPFPARVEM